MAAPTHMELGLTPAPRALLVSLYALILLPIVGTLMMLLTERLARRRLLVAGRHLSALEVRSHGRGALILGLVWSVAYAGRSVLLGLILSVA